MWDRNVSEIVLYMNVSGIVKNSCVVQKYAWTESNSWSHKIKINETVNISVYSQKIVPKTSLNHSKQLCLKGACMTIKFGFPDFFSSGNDRRSRK